MNNAHLFIRLSEDKTTEEEEDKKNSNTESPVSQFEVLRAKLKTDVNLNEAVSV